MSDRNCSYLYGSKSIRASGITEGAIPFAAQNPLRVLPTMVLGSSIAAVLTYLFKVRVPAPHGGFLVLPVVTHGLLWIISILIGSIVGGLILGLIQRHCVQKEGEY